MFFQTVIGLEVHAQIASHSKLFSSAPSDVFNKDPNTCVSFVDAAFPGMLPVINEACVIQAIKLGLAMKGAVRLTSVFDRKHYFYPDNPSGYQISQYSFPLIEGGSLSIQNAEGQEKIIRLQRIHLEQDAGQSTHDKSPGLSHVNFNRAGVGLMEIVSYPDLHTPDEVVHYVKKLRSLMRALGVCHGDMEKGHLRVDANVSLHHVGEPLGTRIELKNINSLRFLHQAITYEIKRQEEELIKGHSLKQETRLFDVASGTTRPMRVKEVHHDYSYFPDPDLLPLVITQETVDLLAKTMPELPWERHQRFIEEWQLSSYDADLLLEDGEVADFFEKVLKSLDPDHRVPLAKSVAHWITGEVFAMLKRASFTTCPITPADLGELIVYVSRKELSHPLAKEVFSAMWETHKKPGVIMDEKGLRQISDPLILRQWIDEVIRKEEQQVIAYRQGKQKIFPYLVGQTMKHSQGKANPQIIQTLLREVLDKKE